MSHATGHKALLPGCPGCHVGPLVRFVGDIHSAAPCHTLVAHADALLQASETPTVDTWTEDAEASFEDSAIDAKTSWPTSQLRDLFAQFTGKIFKNDDFAFTPLGNGTVSEDGSTLIEVGLKLPHGWKQGTVYHGSGATIQEAKDAAAATAMKALGNFTKYQWRGMSNHTSIQRFAQRLGRALKGNVEVIGLEIAAKDAKANDGIGALLVLLAELGKDSEIGHRLTARVKSIRNQRDYLVRIRRNQKLRSKSVTAVNVTNVAKTTKPGRLAGHILQCLRKGNSVKLKLSGEGAAANAAHALCLLEEFDNNTQQFSFASRFSFLNADLPSITVDVAPS